MMRGLLVLLGLLFANTGLWSATDSTITLYPAASVAAPVKGVAPGVRGVGMGEAYTAPADDLAALHWNPAGLNQLREPQLGFMHNEWQSSLGMRQEQLAYGQRLDFGGLAASFDYFSLGDLERRDKLGASEGQASAYHMGGSLGAGFNLFSKLDLGLSLGAASETLYGSTGATLITGNIGMIWKPMLDTKVGLAGVNLGTASGGFNTPSSASLGVAQGFWKNSFLVSAEATMPFQDSLVAKGGAEAWFFEILALRGGWRQRINAEPGDVGSGFTAGMGIKMGIFKLDYAYVPYGDLSTTHRVAASMGFPSDLFAPKVVISDKGGSLAAKAYYDQGQKAYRNKELVEAMLAYRQALQADPKFAPAKAALAKVQNEFEAQRRSGGENPEVKRLIEKNMNDGLKAFNEGNFSSAIKAWETVLTFDKTYNMAMAYLNRARGKVEENLVSHRNTAAAALARGDFKAAARSWRQMLKVDDSNAEAKAKLALYDKKIKETIKMSHRKGIDFYVGGKVKDAVREWKEGLEMDPSDPDGLKRDIDKAQKLLELRGEN
jgi:hypothetical protein